MRKLHVFSLFFLLYGLSGCDLQTDSGQSESIEGLKLSDLRSISQETLEPKQTFWILSYRVPVDSASKVSSALDFLDPLRMTFQDRQAFEKNGFWAALGRAEQASAAVAALNRIGAGHKGQISMFLDASYREEFGSVPFPEGQSIFFYRADGTLAGRQVLPGMLCWTLRMQPRLQQRNMIQLQLIPVYRSQLSRDLARAAGAQSLDIPFEEALFETYMTEGDFLVLAADRFEPETNTLSRLFEDWHLKKPYVLVYIIVCVDLKVV